MEREFKVDHEGRAYSCREVAGILAINHDAPPTDAHLEVCIDGVWRKAFDLNPGDSDTDVEQRAVDWIRFTPR